MRLCGNRRVAGEVSASTSGEVCRWVGTAGMLAIFRDSSPQNDQHGTVMRSQNAKLGFLLFGIYLLLYGAFVFVNAFAPSTMEWTPGEEFGPLAGVNLAVLSGFGLIVVAILMALLYGLLCGSDGDDRGERA